MEVGAAEPEAIQHLSQEPTRQAYFHAYQADFFLIIIWASLQILCIGGESLANHSRILADIFLVINTWFMNYFILWINVNLHLCAGVNHAPKAPGALGLDSHMDFLS